MKRIARWNVTVLAVVAALLGAASAVAAAAPLRTQVSATVDVTADQFADNEESLGMSPDGSLLAGAWNDWDFNDGCGFAYSTTGGDTWAPRTFVPGLTRFTNDPNIPGTGKFDAAGDPSVAYNPRSGLFDVICQAFGTATGNQIQLLSTTFNAAKANPNANENQSYGAAAWTTPVAITTGTSNGSQKGSNGQFPDHEAIIVDTGTGANHHFGRLYAAWAQFNGFGRSPINLAYSDNDGQTWNGPITVSDSNHQFDQDAHPTVGPDGTVYVTWINSPNEKSLKNNVAMIGASTDGGDTWTKSYSVAPIVGVVNGLLPNSNYRVFADVTSAVDQATGRVVVAFNDKKTGASNIYVSYQLTPGNLSQWSAPNAIKPSGQEQFFPWMVSAPNGRVDLVYYDRTCDAADTNNCVTLSSSTDGGASWSSAYVLSQGFDGDKYQACLAFVQPANCGNFFLGDYIAVNSTNGKAQVLYTGNGPQAMDVFSVRATFK